MGDASIRHSIDAARTALRGNPRSHLELSHRRQIWIAYGPALQQPGWSIRTRLAIAAARHVLGNWQHTFPNDRMAEDALQFALDVSSGGIAQRAQFREMVGRFESIQATPQQDDGVNAGYACLKASRTALFDEDSQGPERTDDELDYQQWDASFYASLSAAGGGIWQQTSNDERRREFWEWYLDEAATIVSA